MALISTLLALRRDRRVLKLPPYLSALCIVVGIAWLLVLPLQEYSRNTYVSENALLPGQVHTYFTGSEHNVFRAYRQEVHALSDKSVQERTQKLAEIFRANSLKVATQKYTYQLPNRTVSGENVYAILQGPRADATEAMVLIGAWTNMADEVNTSGVALVLTLARYFKRWSLWSKDVIFLISGDSTSGPKAWVDAYHNEHDERYVESLSIKSGALQGAIAVDYPAGPWGHRYDKLHIVYDGVNGQLPNLDLFNTAVSVAGGQMGIGTAIQRMWKHDDSYQERLQTIFRGLLSQGLGHSTGPHSSFIPYHVDAITLSTYGDGWHDEISLGKVVESLFRSLNNLLEHLHQSFFFYLLLHTNRFVSIGTYLPAAMLIAVNFSITSIALWVASGRQSIESKNTATAKPRAEPTGEKAYLKAIEEKKKAEEKKTEKTEEKKPEKTVENKIEKKEDQTPVAKSIHERALLFPLLTVLGIHAAGLFPLWAFHWVPQEEYRQIFFTSINVSAILPFVIAVFFNSTTPMSPQQTTLLQSFSLLFLGMFLAALATVNFSLSFLVGVLAAPLSFVRSSKNSLVCGLQLAVLFPLNPIFIVFLGTKYFGINIIDFLATAAEGWYIWGLWTPVVFWLVWFPAWLVAGVVVAKGVVEG